MTSKLLPSIAVALGLSVSGIAMGDTPHQGANDEAGIRKVIDQFQQALKDKNKDHLLALFIDENAPVIASASDKTMARVRQKKADAAKILRKTSGKFANEIAEDTSSGEEQFSHVKIDADSDVAAVSFDFTFLSDGKPMNVGKEAWVLVRSESGWKITSIVYSMNFPESK
ncbi:MAG: hypothetical protein GAK28_04679 [Luteibacter sp.]|uniref:nuclear transport factor 2 family protein n=1 Tax=Luteibacter sp. TaxID=1886636 RepID=UPI0013848495|nr:nuclear transport factor 2 family protein [Luteibacter sp.]KAF1003472.1 MAG: hypothetical protein GAK28_04679 [Luteibacter sp.]